MLFFRSKHEKEEIQDKIDDIDMAIYRRRCDIASAMEKDDKEAVDYAKKRIAELEKKRKRLKRKI